MLSTTEKNIFGRTIKLESGKLAKQANGSVLITCGNSVMLATATMSKNCKTDLSFFPLTVEYSEKMYSSGKIPGGFFKRESRPSTSATLTSRLIDRPIRPCFPDGLFNEVQIVITVLSYDESYSPEFLGIIGASAAISISDIPFNSPVGAILIGYINGKLEVNPSTEDMEKSTLNLIVAGTKDAILMVEAGANEVSEELIIEALNLAQKAIKETIELQEELISKVGKAKQLEVIQNFSDAETETKINNFLADKIETNLRKGNKQETEIFLAALEKDVLITFVDPEKINQNLVKQIYKNLKKDKIRKTIIKEKVRPDNRKLDEIRPISSEINLLPSVHGSALFTRGETQSLAVITLGTTDDEQIEDGLSDSQRKSYYFHYNFPPFSVGEVGMMRTGRRELGHGALAERALKPILPAYDGFPYTIRIVSEILESNGSSSMASVCSGSLALMDAGVPIKSPVSGIAMGLLLEGNDYVVLSDIQGLEDHYGDMDFKVAGTSAGITALQLDIKVGGLSEAILKNALAQAKKGRAEILGKMCSLIEKPKDNLSPYAPKIEFLTVNSDKIGLIIGPGGKMIKQLEEKSNAHIVVSDGASGQISISGRCLADVEKAKNMIIALVKDIEIGETFEGKVVRITNFGAFVELVPGKDGLLHISTLSERHISRVEDVLKEGDLIQVRVRDIDKQKRISLEPVTLL